MTTLTPICPGPARPGSRTTPGMPRRSSASTPSSSSTLLTLGPVLWTISTSMRPVHRIARRLTESDSAQSGHRVPATSSTRSTWLLILNSILVTAACASQMSPRRWAGYVSRKVDFRGKNALFAIVLAAMMVPMQVTIVPVFMLICGMGGSPTPCSPLILLAIPDRLRHLLDAAVPGPPDELSEAAQIDGARPVADVLLDLRPAGHAGDGDRRHSGLQLPLERVLRP